MVFSSCVSLPLVSLKISRFGQPSNLHHHVEMDQRFTSVLKSRTTEHFGRQARIGAGLLGEWSFARGTRLVIRQRVSTLIHCRKSFECLAFTLVTWSELCESCTILKGGVATSERVSYILLSSLATVVKRTKLDSSTMTASFVLLVPFVLGHRTSYFPVLLPGGLLRSYLQPSGLTTSQIASSVFSLGTAAVLPFYTLMIFAPKAELTKMSMESSIPYIVLGLLYAYLLYLSWTPDTLRLMFASKYWLPELSGMAKMFSSEMTLASAWIHLLAVDLFAARQVFHDGLQNQVETRHSVSLCLLFCPIGIFSHFVTKALARSAGNNRHGMH